jgi:hypothetical protein
VAALIGGVLLYAHSQLFDPETLGDNAGAALADEAVREAISPTIAAAIGSVSPENEPSTEEVAQALDDPRVAGAFEAAAAVAAKHLFGKGEGGQVDLDLSEVTATAIGATQDTSANQLGVSAADFESARLNLITGKAVLDVLETAERIGWLGLILTPIGALALLLSVALARDRPRALVFAAVSVAVAAAFVLAALYVGREVVVAQFTDQLTKDAVSGAWSALLGGLRSGAIVVAGVAAVIALLAGLAASRRQPAYH